MDAMICKCCGDKINSYNMRCEYCGTSYDHNIPTYMIKTYQAPVDHFSACVAMDMDAVRQFGAEKASEICIKELTRKLSEALANDIKITSEYRPVTDQRIVRGDIKLIRPIDTGRSDLFV